MSRDPRILLIGTADTKSDELQFLRAELAAQGAGVVLMDVGVLGEPRCEVEITHDEVALAAGTTLAAIRGATDENEAMRSMARGAAALAARWHAEGRIDGLLALGGTMGTDLALDVAQALPLGVPKLVLSTVAHSPLLAPERIAPDLMTMLWAGGLYGLNALCRSSLSQAAGAVVGAARAACRPQFDRPQFDRPQLDRPMIGMTSLGSSCLRYMVTLMPALQARGFEVAVFHTTGMGGRAFEALAAERRFVAVMDFSLQELVNHLAGSVVTAGPDRLRGAGRAGVPQIVAPGAIDMIDMATWQPVPAAVEGRPVHVHNRLIASATSAPPLRRRIAATMADRLAAARGPCRLLLPLRGIQAWDRPGEPLHDPDGLAAFIDETRMRCAGRVEVDELDAHINDEAFSARVLAIVDDWVARGIIAMSPPSFASPASPASPAASN